MKNRASPDILAAVLECVSDSMSNTRIMTKANLTSEQLKTYMEIAMKNKLIDYSFDKTRKYDVTIKGRRFLQKYEELKSYAIFFNDKNERNAYTV